MTIVVLVLALAVLAGIIAGGSVRFLEHIRVHWWGLAPIALVLQSFPLPVGSAERAGLAAASLVASYVLLLAVVAVNRRVPGAALMATGLMMNLAVVALNGGMPVSRDAVLAAGADGAIVIEDGAKHHLMTEADVLRPLADVIPVGPPFGVVLSIRRRAAVRGDGVVVFHRHAWTVPREPQAAGSPIPDVPGEACPGGVSLAGSVPAGSGDGSCWSSEVGNRTVIVVP